MDRSWPPMDRSIGLALRELMDASPKAVRRAVEDRHAAEDLVGGKRAKKEETRRLVSSLDAVTRFLTDFSALEHSGDSTTAHPVLDPLLERIVRPTAGRGSGTKPRTSDRSTSSGDEKKTALRLVAWLVSPAEREDGVARDDEEIRRVAAVSRALVERCAPPTSRRTRLAACLALKHAVVCARALAARREHSLIRAAAADALLATIGESERAREETDPPTRLAVAAVDAALAVTARAAIAAAEGDDDDASSGGDFAAHARVARETCAVVRGWWRSGSRARAPAVALDEVVRAFDTVARWSVRAAAAKDDTGEAERRRWLARAWQDWAPLVAADGFLAFPDPAATQPGGPPKETRAANGGDLDLAPGAVRLARWLATAAAAAADDTAGVSGAGDRLRHALVATSLAVGQLGLADGADAPSPSGPSDPETPTRGKTDARASDAASLFRAHAAETLVPALRSRASATRELGAALLRAALVPRASAGWGPEQTALLDGLLPLLEEAPEAITPGLASLAAALVAAQPGGAGRRFVQTLCVSVSPAARRNAALVLGESLRAPRGGGPLPFPENGNGADDHFVAALRALAPRVSETSERDGRVRAAARAAVRDAPPRETVAACVFLAREATERDDATETGRPRVDEDAFEAVLLAALRGRGAVVATRALLEALRDDRGVLFANAKDASTMGAGVARAVETFAAWFREAASARDAEAAARAGFDPASLEATARVVVDAALFRDGPSDASGTKKTTRVPCVASSTATARVVAELAPWIGVPPASRAAFAAARDALREAPFSAHRSPSRHPRAGTDEPAGGRERPNGRGRADEADRDPVAVAFARLAPLLLLRAMRADAWDDWAEARADEAARDDATVDDVAKDSLGSLLLALTSSSSNAPDDARRLAAELHGRVVPARGRHAGESGAAAARVAAMESALDASRWGDARAAALAALSGLASRGVDALGPETSVVRDRHRRAFVRMATLGRGDVANPVPGNQTREPADVEVAKTRAGGAETLARTVAAELAAPRAAPAGGLGAGLGDGSRVSTTLDGLVAVIVGDPRAPPWAVPAPRAVPEGGADAEEERAAADRRVALADALIGAVRIVMDVHDDRALAEAFARATYPRLAAHASSGANASAVAGTERDSEKHATRAACFSLCATAFAFAATDASRRDPRREPRGGGDEGGGRSDRAHDARDLHAARRFHKLAVLAHARDLGRAAARALRDGAAAPAARAAAAGLATAMLAADDDALEAIARCGALDELRSALEVAARVDDVSPLADAARGLLRAMGA